jgi:hypothetical protein
MHKEVEIPETDDPVAVETHVKVYLIWSRDERRWIVDGPTMDGSELDSEGTYCDAGDYADQDPQTRAEWDKANRADLPTGHELIKLLTEAAAIWPQPVGQS